MRRGVKGASLLGLPWTEGRYRGVQVAGGTTNELMDPSKKSGERQRVRLAGTTPRESVAISREVDLDRRLR